MKTVTILVCLFVLTFSSCKTVKSNSVSDINNIVHFTNNIIHFKGKVKCPSGEIDYLNKENDIDLLFNKNICSSFEKELDSVGSTIQLYIDWMVSEDDLYPISSFVKVYDNNKLKLDRSMSFKTWPTVKDEQKFKKSLYYRISQIRPELVTKTSKDSITKVEVLLIIKK